MHLWPDVASWCVNTHMCEGYYNVKVCEESGERLNNRYIGCCNGNKFTNEGGLGAIVGGGELIVLAA